MVEGKIDREMNGIKSNIPIILEKEVGKTRTEFERKLVAVGDDMYAKMEEINTKYSSATKRNESVSDSKKKKYSYS